jgi:hypothetical protein
MRSSCSWRPGPERSAEDMGLLVTTTQRAIVDLLAVADRSKRRKVIGVLRQWKPASQICHPEVFHWYFEVRQNPGVATDYKVSLNAVGSEVSESRARASQNEAVIGVPIDLASATEGVGAALRRGASYAQRLTQEPVQLTALSEVDKEARNRIGAACGLIRNVWPEVLEEMPVFVKKLIVYKGHAVIGFTDFRYHGSIFFKHEWLMRRNSIEEVAEDLIHEAAHVRLNAVMACTPLFSNDDSEIYPSPLRRDLRSMYGVFHQMFVLFRVAEFHRRLRGTGLLTEPCNLAHAASDFCMAFNTVKTHARLTRIGRSLVRSIEADMSVITPLANVA